MQWSLQHIQSPRWCFHFQKCAGSPSLLRRNWFLLVCQRHKQTRLQRSAPCRVWQPRPVAPLWEGMTVRARLRMASPSHPCPRTRSVLHLEFPLSILIAVGTHLPFAVTQVKLSLKIIYISSIRFAVPGLCCITFFKPHLIRFDSWFSSKERKKTFADTHGCKCVSVIMLCPERNRCQQREKLLGNGRTIQIKNKKRLSCIRSQCFFFNICAFCI